MWVLAVAAPDEARVGNAGWSEVGAVGALPVGYPWPLAVGY